MTTPLESAARGREGKAGLTLVEVLVASALVGLLTVAVYSVVINAVSLNYAVAQRVAAFTLCKEKLEQLRGSDYHSVTASNCAAQTVFLTHLGGTARVPLTGTRAGSLTGLSNPDRKSVTVTVQWDYRGRQFEESMTGVIYRKE
ncbi:type II secretion system protein J [Verrucomicrobiota bacterium]